MNHAGLADHVVEAFHLRGGTMARSIPDGEMFLRHLVSVVATSDEESVPIHLVSEAGELPVARSQDCLTRTR